MKIKDLFIREKKPAKGLLAFEWVAFGYLAFTVLMMVALWNKIGSRWPAGPFITYGLAG